MNRHIDNLGRIVIPKEIRKSLGLLNNELVNIELDNNRIILTKVDTSNALSFEVLENMPKEELINLLLNKK